MYTNVLQQFISRAKMMPRRPKSKSSKSVRRSVLIDQALAIIPLPNIANCLVASLAALLIYFIGFFDLFKTYVAQRQCGIDHVDKTLLHPGDSCRPHSRRVVMR